MRVFVAGATGAIGRALVPMLVREGHQVVGLARNPEAAERVSRLGASPVVADAFDRESVVAAIVQSRPEAIMHQLTAIPAALNPRRIGEQFALTNRLRTEGTGNLLAGAQAAGAGRFIAQSIAFAYEPAGEVLRTEDDPLWARPPRKFAAAVEALRRLEAATLGAGGTVLRYGQFYGPGTSFAADGAIAEQVRRGRFPVVGGGGSVFSFVHVDDAAGAAVQALATAAEGIFNIVDDDPVQVREWLPDYARRLGAPPPRHVPALLARPVVGEYGIAYLTRLSGASNAKARRVMNWRPMHASWRSAMAGEVVLSGR